MNNTPINTALPDWIANESLLRDEAVLFGLSDARPDEKLAAIRLAFAAQTASLEKDIEQGHETVGDLNGSLDKATHELTQLTQQADTLPRPPIGWALLGLGVTVGGSIGVALFLQRQLPDLNWLTILLAGVLAVSGCVGTLLLAVTQHRAQLAQHQRRIATQAATIKTLRQQLGSWQAEKSRQVAALYAAEARLTQLNATRDRLLRLFESEYNLARSVRDRVNENLLYSE